MRAVIFHEFAGPPVVAEVADPACPPDGVVVAVEATGLCRSDWHGWQGHDPGITLPHVPGHELAGRIVEVGADVGVGGAGGAGGAGGVGGAGGGAGWRVGDRVTAPFVLACGRCRTCARGDQQVCEAQLQPGFTQWGSYADLVALPRADTNLVRVPDAVDSDVAAALGCRFATAYRAVAQVALVRPGESVVVHGCGGVGLSAVMVAVALGARVYAVDLAPDSLALAAALGAVPVPVDELGSLPDLTGGGADVSLDALGSPVTLAASLRCLRPRGRHVQVGLLSDAGSAAEVTALLGGVIGRELQLLGSHGMSAAAYPELLALVADGTLTPQRLLRGSVGLAEGAARLARLGEPGSGAGGITVIRPAQA